MRRALHKLVRNEVISIGDGGRGDPLRYALHPFLIAFLRDKAQLSAWSDAVEKLASGGAVIRGLRPLPKPVDC